MAQITITQVGLTETPAANQTVTVRYKLAAADDILGNYTLVTNSAVINTSGVFTTPVVISGLANNTEYTIWITNNCGGTGVKDDVATPLPTCVEITSITATATD